MRSGDRAALDEIFCRYSERAYRLAYHMLGDCEDARDVCQDAFIRVYRRIGDFDGKSSFRSSLTFQPKTRCQGGLKANASRFTLQVLRPFQPQDPYDEETEMAEILRGEDR